MGGRGQGGGANPVVVSARTYYFATGPHAFDGLYRSMVKGTDVRLRPALRLYDTAAQARVRARAGAIIVGVQGVQAAELGYRLPIIPGAPPMVCTVVEVLRSEP